MTTGAAEDQEIRVASTECLVCFVGPRSPDTATPDDVRRFQLHFLEAGHSIGNRNRIMTGVKISFRLPR